MRQVKSLNRKHDVWILGNVVTNVLIRKSNFSICSTCCTHTCPDSKTSILKLYSAEVPPTCFSNLGLRGAASEKKAALKGTKAQYKIRRSYVLIGNHAKLLQQILKK